MAAQEIFLKISANPALFKSAMNEVRSAYTATVTDFTKQTRQEVQAAISLQRQRSSAYVAEWKKETRDHDREQQNQKRAAESLQRQRSSALISIWKAEQREQVRIAREAQREIERAQAASQQRRSAFFAGAAGGLTALVGVSAVSEIKQAGAAWLDYASKLETTRIAFTTMLGSAEAADQHLKQLQKFALTTPFQFGELIDASQRMQALGFSANQVIPLLNDVGNAVAAAGGGGERLDRVVLALSQIQSKGKVATQELNQLAESGISGFKILEQATGKSGDALRKMVEDGKISSQVFLDAFQKFSQQNFGGLMEAQSKTFTGAMSNIKDALLQTSATAFAPLYERLSESARELAKLSTESKEFQKNMETVGRQVVQVWDGLVEMFYVVRDVIGLVGAVGVQVFGGLTHVILATAEAARGVYFGLQAISRFLVGDFRGALELANKSTAATENAANRVTQALKDQGAVAQQVVRIYENAEARKAAAAISATQKITAALVASGATRAFGPPTIAPGTTDPRTGLGTGILRKRDTGTTSVSSGGGGGGSAEKISEGQRLLNQLTDEYNRLQAKSNDLSKVQIVALEILDDKYKGLTASLRRQILEQAAQIDTAQKAADLDKRKAEATEKIRALLDKQTEAIRDARIGEKEWTDQIVELEAELKKLGLTMDDNTRKLLKDNAATQQALTLTRERIALEKTRIELMERERLATPERKQEQLERESGIFRSEGDETRERTVNPPNVSIWDEALKAIEQRMGNFQDASKAFHEHAKLYVVGAFEGMTAAAQDAIQAWILYGGSLGKALKQALAAELANVAARASVQAILHAAYAIGSLAFGDFAGAAKHGIAAAKFAAVAIATGVAAKALVGGAAAAGGGAAAGSASSAFRSSMSSAAQRPGVTDVNRRTSEPPRQPVRDVVEIRFTGQLGDVIEAQWIDRYRGGGKLRNLVLSDGSGG